MALDDDLIRRNPFEFELATVIVNDSVTREAITREQERKYLEFVKNDAHFKRYYEGIFILFKTGLRISEFVGLTIKNIDFTNHKIIVDHQLIRTSDMTYMIEAPKTESGVREIPMTPDVEDAFRTIIKNRKKPKVEPKVDGYSACHSYIWIRMTCRWLHFTGKNIFNISCRNIIVFIECKCQR